LENELFNKEIKKFVDLELHIYFQDIIQLSQQSTKYNDVAHKASQETLKQTVTKFSQTWKKSLDMVRHDVMTLFPNKVTGEDILKLVLTQFLYNCKRFQDLVKTHYPSLYTQIKDNFVALTTLTHHCNASLSQQQHPSSLNH